MQMIALHLVDDILEWLLPVEKAEDPDEIRLEVDLARLIKQAWDEQVVAALDQATRLLRAGKGPLTPDDVTAVLTILETMLGPGMAVPTQEDLLRFVTSAYLLGRRKTIKTLGVAPNWAQIDDWSISVSQRHSVYWVQSYYSRELGQLVASTAEDLVFRQGLGRMDLARELQARLGNEWWAQGYQYWDVLASAVIQRTRNLANVNTLEAAGATTYEILAMMDERTCPVCSRLDGMRFEVSQAVQLRDRILAAQSPEDVKTISPWITATKENLAILDRRDPKEIVSRGWHLPPFHGRCRCTVVVASVEVLAPTPSAQVSEPAWALGAPDISFKELQGTSAKLMELFDTHDKREAPGETSKRIAKALAERLKGNKDWENLCKDWNMSSEHTVQFYLTKWAATSADDDPQAIAVQLAVRDEFKLAKTVTEHFGKHGRELGREVYKQHGRALRAFVRAMYDHTQEWLKEQNVDYICLFRGMGIQRDDESEPLLDPFQSEATGVRNFRLQPANSFSVNMDIAIGFAHYDARPLRAVLCAKVPRERILGTCQTGYGTKYEAEVVVLGGQEDDDVFWYYSWERGASVWGANIKAALERFLASRVAKSFRALLGMVVKGGRQMPKPLCFEDAMNADWIKWRWNLPPYKSPEFMEHLKLLRMTLDDFRKLPKYQFAVEQGLIVNDEWAGR